MNEITIDSALIEQFESGLDPRHPEHSRIPARVLGYGEISTVLEIGTGDQTWLAYKRMPMFENQAEAEAYLALYGRYLQLLAQAGINLVPSAIQAMPETRPRVVVYIAQQKLPVQSIAHQAIHLLPDPEVMRLFDTVLSETNKVFTFNRAHEGRLAIGFDAQISNWAIAGFDPMLPRLPETVDLLYFDTSAPLLRQDGAEQLDPELFLRSAPSFLVWIIRLFLLDEVMNRYYDQRKVIIDVVANFYKEGRPELIPELVGRANDFLAAAGLDLAPLSAQEIEAYYKDDARTWRIYLAFRKIDRTLHRLLAKDYPYVLPEKIKR